MTNPITEARRHYEDIMVGEIIAFPSRQISKAEIIDFARAYDPFPFHLDEKAAQKSLLGGLAASGYQTGAFALRMLGDTFLNTIASMGGLGFTDLKWKRPLMKDDTLTGTATITAKRRSRRRPNIGIVTIALDLRNQKNEQVMTINLDNMVEVRDPSASLAESVA